MSSFPPPLDLSSIQPITDFEFGRFQQLIRNIAGISICPAKKMMVSSRLQRRLAVYGLRRFSDYYRLVTSESHPDELQIVVDLLTTHETYFFREPSHFVYLRDHILKHRPAHGFRVWSAACSSGEEVYSLAMLLADTLDGEQWEVLGSDISLQMLQRARRGHYPMERNEGIQDRYLKHYCLKGVRSQENTFLIDRRLKARVNFRQVNLKQSLPHLGRFDVIFLRNVLIYFDAKTKREIVRRVIGQLNPEGYLFISHTENIQGIAAELQQVNPAVFRKSRRGQEDQ